MTTVAHAVSANEGRLAIGTPGEIGARPFQRWIEEGTGDVRRSDDFRRRRPTPVRLAFDGTVGVIAASSYAETARQVLPRVALREYPTWEAVVDAVERNRWTSPTATNSRSRS